MKPITWALFLGLGRCTQLHDYNQKQANLEDVNADKDFHLQAVRLNIGTNPINSMTELNAKEETTDLGSELAWEKHGKEEVSLPELSHNIEALEFTIYQKQHKMKHQGYEML